MAPIKKQRIGKKRAIQQQTVVDTTIVVRYAYPSLSQLIGLAQAELETQRQNPSPERALRNLQGAGILNKRGQLTKPYKNLCTPAETN